MGFIKENIGIISKVMMVVFLLSIVAVATFQSSLFIDRSSEEPEQELENATFEENQTSEPIPEEPIEPLPKPEETPQTETNETSRTEPEEKPQTEPEQEPQTEPANVSAEQPSACELLENLPTDTVELHRRIANLSEENRKLKKEFESQKDYIQTYKREKDKAERDLATCLNNLEGDI